MVDPNEITGFIQHCTNANWLRMMRGHIRDRLRELGEPEGIQADRHDGPGLLTEAGRLANPKAIKPPQTAAKAAGGPEPGKTADPAAPNASDAANGGGI